MMKKLILSFVLSLIFLGLAITIYSSVVGTKSDTSEVISSLQFTSQDRKAPVDAALYFTDKVVLRIDKTEIAINTATETMADADVETDIAADVNTSADIDVNADAEKNNIGELKKHYTLEDMGNGIISVIHTMQSARGEYVQLDLFSYRDKQINKLWSSRDLSAYIQALNTEKRQFVIGLSNSTTRTLDFSDDELIRWKQRVAELEMNKIKIDDTYFSSIHDCFLIEPLTYRIQTKSDSLEKEMLILAGIRTVGSKSPYIRDRAVVTLAMDNGVISIGGIVFERDHTDTASTFASFH